jgi:uncharacterized delta-60 repeat protein
MQSASGFRALEPVGIEIGPKGEQMSNVTSVEPRSTIRRAVLALLLALPAAASPAQAATLVSETTWGGASSEVVGDAAVAADGSTYLTGFTTSFGTTPSVIFAVNFASDGSLSWQRTWEGPQQFGDDQGSDVAVASDGSVYVTGSTPGVAGDAVLLKFAPDGSLVWQRRWGGSGTERGEAVAVAGDGSVYVVGGTSSFGQGGLFVLRFAPDGTLVWQRLREGGAAEGVAVAGDGSVYAAGLLGRPGGLGDSDVQLVKLDPAGTLVWQRVYSTARNVDARGGVAVGPDGSVYAAGALQDTDGKVVVDALLLKFTPDGALAWDRSWGGRSGDVSAGVAVASTGTVLWSGDSNSFGAGSDDAFLLHVSPDGKALDADTWGGAGIEHGDGVDVAPDGTISLGATAENPPFSFLRAPTKLSRPRGTVSTPETPLVEIFGTLVDPGGTVTTPAGTTPGAGGFDAALVRITP